MQSQQSIVSYCVRCRRFELKTTVLLLHWFEIVSNFPFVLLSWKVKVHIQDACFNDVICVRGVLNAHSSAGNNCRWKKAMGEGRREIPILGDKDIFKVNGSQQCFGNNVCWEHKHVVLLCWHRRRRHFSEWEWLCVHGIDNARPTYVNVCAVHPWTSFTFVGHIPFNEMNTNFVQVSEFVRTGDETMQHCKQWQSSFQENSRHFGVFVFPASFATNLWMCVSVCVWWQGGNGQ